MDDPAVPGHMASLAESTSLSSNLAVRKRGPASVRLTANETRYNQIIRAISKQIDSQDAMQKVKFHRRWHNIGKDGKPHWDESHQIFTLDKKSVKSIIDCITGVSTIMTKIDQLKVEQGRVAAQNYYALHDQYLRLLIQLHTTIRSEARHVVEILSDIREMKDKLRMSKEVTSDDSEIDIEQQASSTSQTVSPSASASASASPAPRTPERMALPALETLFPNDPLLQITENDCAIARKLFRAHSEYELYVISVRNEVLNCLMDNRRRTVQLQLVALERMYIPLNPTDEDRLVLNPSKGRLDRNKLRTQCMSAYEAHNNDGHYWCQVSKNWMVTSDDITTSHIVPAATDPETVTRFFGDPEAARIVNSPRNILFMHRKLETAFDQGKFSIVPVPNSAIQDEFSELIEFRVIFIDRSLPTSPKTQKIYGFAGSAYQWADLAENPQLVFQGDFRPGLRNLYYHHIFSLMRAKIHQYPGYIQALSEFETVWPASCVGKWASRSFIEELSREFAMPEILRTETLLEQPQIDELSQIYRAKKLPWYLPSSNDSNDDDNDDYDDDDQDNDVPIDPAPSTETPFPYLSMNNFTSPRTTRLLEAIDNSEATR